VSIVAEFCYQCFQKYFDANAKENDLIFSTDLDLCEGCGEYKPVVVCYDRRKTRIEKQLLFWKERRKRFR